VKKLIMSLVVIGACSSSSPTPAPAPTTRSPVLTGNQSGAGDALAAVRGFMSAAKEQDIQTMGGIFGDTQGPARDRIPRDELDKRSIIMMCYLKHDRYDIVGDAQAAGGGRSVVVNLTYKDLTRSTHFQVVTGPQQRWYVRSFEPSTLQDICSKRG
jgi:hypothetical protein